MAVNDAPSPPPGVIRYRQLWVSDDGVTHLAERRFVRLREGVEDVECRAL